MTAAPPLGPFALYRQMKTRFGGAMTGEGPATSLRRVWSGAENNLSSGLDPAQPRRI